VPDGGRFDPTERRGRREDVADVVDVAALVDVPDVADVVEPADVASAGPVAWSLVSINGSCCCSMGQASRMGVSLTP
jgi:hypothetical protein